MPEEMASIEVWSACTFSYFGLYKLGIDGWSGFGIETTFMKQKEY